MKGYCKTVLINRAVPGSGKTTFSNCIYDAVRGAGLSIAVHSTDSFFMVGNQYKFDLKNPKVHVNYVWDEKALRLKKSKASISHFDYDDLLVIDPNEYHVLKDKIGALMLNRFCRVGVVSGAE